MNSLCQKCPPSLFTTSRPTSFTVEGFPVISPAGTISWVKHTHIFQEFHNSSLECVLNHSSKNDIVVLRWTQVFFFFFSFFSFLILWSAHFLGSPFYLSLPISYACTLHPQTPPDYRIVTKPWRTKTRTKSPNSSYKWMQCPELGVVIFSS